MYVSEVRRYMCSKIIAAKDMCYWEIYSDECSLMLVLWTARGGGGTTIVRTNVDKVVRN